MDYILHAYILFNLVFSNSYLIRANIAFYQRMVIKWCFLFIRFCNLSTFTHQPILSKLVKVTSFELKRHYQQNKRRKSPRWSDIKTNILITFMKCAIKKDCKVVRITHEFWRKSVMFRSHNMKNHKLSLQLQEYQFPLFQVEKHANKPFCHIGQANIALQSKCDDSYKFKANSFFHFSTQTHSQSKVL